MSTPNDTSRSDEASSLVVKFDPPAQLGKSTTAETIQVFDQFGKPVQLPRDAWRAQILLPNLAAKRNEPEALIALIVSALRDGFAADVLDSVRHLAVIDPQPLRSANLLGVVLLQLNKFDEARASLETAIAAHGEDPYVLTNLAKAYAGLGESAKSDAILWRAIERDPNLDNGLLWYAAIEAERGGGPAGQQAAFERIARLPASWRAQLWLAREALSRNEVAQAAGFYREALGRMNRVPADALMQISGDLGNRGQPALLLELCTPRFDLQRHGIQVGNNLLKAYLDLGRTREARSLLTQLSAQQRPDWRGALKDWERWIDDAERRFGAIEGTFNVRFLALEQPLCIQGRLGFEALVPRKLDDAPRVTFVCGTANPAGPEGGQAVTQRTDALAQMTRVIPLYLAEEVHLRSSAQTRVLIPVIAGGGFVLSAAPWQIEDLRRSVSDSEAVVLVHADARTTPWSLKYTLVSWPQGATLAEWTGSLNPAQPLTAVQQAYERLARELTALLGSRTSPVSSPLPLSGTSDAQRYLFCLESALVLGTADLVSSEQAPVYGERALIEALLNLATSSPTSTRCRLLVLNSFEKEARRRPEIVREYLERLSLLQQWFPLPEGSPADLVSGAIKVIYKTAHGA